MSGTVGSTTGMVSETRSSMNSLCGWNQNNPNAATATTATASGTFLRAEAVVDTPPANHADAEASRRG